MVKRGILLIIMMISTLGIYSFNKYNAEDAKTSFASYYHDKFNGRKTASGDIFSNSKMTAANRTLPFGTKVKVTNLRSGKSVIVEINDRGPFSRGRVIDISHAAAREIGMHRSGTARVKLALLNDD